MVSIVTATGLEYREARRCIAAKAPVVRAGIGLKKQRRFEGIAISCGLAGGLRADLPTGTVLVPRSLSVEGNTSKACDEQLTQLLIRAAQELGYTVIEDPLLTSASIVRGELRAQWSRRGYAGVDMESALIEAHAIACVRVVLDTPKYEISDAWEHPAAVLFRPSAWLEIPFLLKEAPRCAQRAAQVIARALESVPEVR